MTPPLACPLPAPSPLRVKPTPRPRGPARPTRPDFLSGPPAGPSSRRPGSDPRGGEACCRPAGAPQAVLCKRGTRGSRNCRFRFRKPGVDLNLRISRSIRGAPVPSGCGTRSGSRGSGVTRVTRVTRVAVPWAHAGHARPERCPDPPRRWVWGPAPGFKEAASRCRCPGSPGTWCGGRRAQRGVRGTTLAVSSAL